MEDAAGEDEGVPDGVVVGDGLPGEEDDPDGVAEAAADHVSERRRAGGGVERLDGDAAVPLAGPR